MDSNRTCPRSLTGLAIALLAALTAGCAGVEPLAEAAPSPAPTAVAAPLPADGGWVEALRFSGDVQGEMYRVVAGDRATRSECTGRNSRGGGAWASALFGEVGHDVYELLVTVRPYRGPGLYRAPDVAVQVARPDGAVWQTSSADAATFVVAADEQSGTLDASLTDLDSDTTRLRVGGRWSCRSA